MATLVPLMDSPVTRYGLTWVGKHDVDEGWDSWTTTYHGVDYMLVDMGHRVLVGITQHGEMTMHRTATWQQAATMVAHHAGITWF